jgi:hypothetical protein
VRPPPRFVEKPRHHPERVAREQAARRIQAAVRSWLQCRREAKARALRLKAARNALVRKDPPNSPSPAVALEPTSAPHFGHARSVPSSADQCAAHHNKESVEDPAEAPAPVEEASQVIQREESGEAQLGPAEALLSLPPLPATDRGPQSKARNRFQPGPAVSLPPLVQMSANAMAPSPNKPSLNREHAGALTEPQPVLGMDATADSAHDQEHEALNAPHPISTASVTAMRESEDAEVTQSTERRVSDGSDVAHKVRRARKAWCTLVQSPNRCSGRLQVEEQERQMLKRNVSIKGRNGPRGQTAALPLTPDRLA